MPDTTQVNVKLPVSMKKDWEEYVKDNEEATSISHLIRLSVQREINDKSREVSTCPPTTSTRTWT